jgi:hypothetical protein
MVAHRANFLLRPQQILAGSCAVSLTIKVNFEPVSPVSPLVGASCRVPFLAPPT